MSIGPIGSMEVINSPKTSKWKKCVCILAVVSSVVFIVATGLLAYQVSQANQEIRKMEFKLNGTRKVLEQLNKTSPICMTSECITSAAQLIESLDETADPCDDFYQFACGGWMENNPVPPRLSSWSQFGLLNHRISSFIEEIIKSKNHINDSKAINSTRDMFQACLDIGRIDELALDPLAQLLTSYGQWPMTVDDWSADSTDWRSLSASLTRTFSTGFVLDVFNYIDFLNDPDRNIIYIDQPSLSLQRSVYLNTSDPMNAAVLADYSELVVQSARAIRDHLNSTASDDRIAQEVEQMIQFEVDLAEILADPTGRYKDNRWNNLLRLHQLHDLTDEPIDTKPAISWTKYIRNIYSPLNISICDEEEVIVMEPNYLVKLMPLLAKTPPRVIVNYMLWRVVMKMAPESGEQLQVYFRNVQMDPAQGLQSFWFLQREDQCMDKVQYFWEHALTGTFLEKRSIDIGVKRQMEAMIDDVKAAFVSLAREADWMDEETKEAVRDKAEAMAHVIAFPDWTANRTALEQYYQPLNITNGDHFWNMVQMMGFQKEKELKLLRQPTDRGTWFTAPYVVNAFYHGMYNSISFPVGILQPPFYGKGHLKALNYAAIGSVIGHEISHGFDNNGRKRDKKGLLRSWWNNSTVTKYLERAQCFIDQYNNFSVPELAGMDVTHLNGTKTLGENIADNGGLRQAYRAYQNHIRSNGPEPQLPGLEKYTMEQLFFIAFANIECNAMTKERLRSRIVFGVHCPGRYRVLGPVSNFDEFARAFQCPVGSPMNPVNKCVLW